MLYNAGGAENLEVAGTIAQFANDLAVMLAKHRRGPADLERRGGETERRARIGQPPGHRMVDVDKESALGQLWIVYQVFGRIERSAGNSSLLEKRHDLLFGPRHTPGNPMGIEPLTGLDGAHGWLELRIPDPILADCAHELRPPIDTHGNLEEAVRAVVHERRGVHTMN